ncbi:MAG: DUF4340 domain-containing protein [Spirochaetes bacterium]|nr:DUF4340 domain-containing protein [Spirochaetota bacterium]
MKKRTVAMLVTLGALAALAGVYAYLRLKPAPAAADYEEGAKKELSKLDAEKLQKIVLSDRPEGTLTLVKKDGAWALEPAYPVKLDGSTVDDLVYSFTALFAERTIEEHPSNLGQYGLVPPKAVARAYLADGTVKTIRLGDETPTGNTYYLQVEGDPAVYSVWMNHGQHFHWKVADLRSKALLASINKDEIAYYKARLRSGQTIEAIQKTTDEQKQFQLGFGSYLMLKPYPAPRGVDAEKFDPMLTGIASIDIGEFVDDSPTDLAAYGLAKPWGELLVRDKASTLHLLFGADRGSDRVCFQVAGERAVYAVDKYKLDFLNAKPFDLIDKFVFIPSIDDLDRLDIAAGGATHVFTLARTTKKASEAKAQGVSEAKAQGASEANALGAAEAGAEDEVVVTYTGDGRELKEEWFKKFYQSVIALSIEGEAPRAVPNAPLITISYRLNKGDKRNVTVGLAPYDKIFYATFVDGVGGFALTKVQAEGMLAKMDKLLKGEEITD